MQRVEVGAKCVVKFMRGIMCCTLINSPVGQAVFPCACLPLLITNVLREKRDGEVCPCP